VKEIFRFQAIAGWKRIFDRFLISLLPLTSSYGADDLNPILMSDSDSFKRRTWYNFRIDCDGDRLLLDFRLLKEFFEGQGMREDLFLAVQLDCDHFCSPYAGIIRIRF
jgi:hypothetical protein